MELTARTYTFKNRASGGAAKGYLGSTVLFIGLSVVFWLVILLVLNVTDQRFEMNAFCRLQQPEVDLNHLHL